MFRFLSEVPPSVPPSKPKVHYRVVIVAEMHLNPDELSFNKIVQALPNGKITSFYVGEQSISKSGISNQG